MRTEERECKKPDKSHHANNTNFVNKVFNKLHVLLR